MSTVQAAQWAEYVYDLYDLSKTYKRPTQPPTTKNIVKLVFQEDTKKQWLPLSFSKFLNFQFFRNSNARAKNLENL